MESKEGANAETSGSGSGIKLHVLASSVRTSGQVCTPPSQPSTAGSETTKILSRNCNGTVVLTSSPNNEAELQLYRVMQRASLLAYYDTLLEMGGDDVQQLCDAGEEEFLEIMALVGMASKPLHVRRLQKALQEWVTSPGLFQTPLSCSSPTNPEPFPVANSRVVTTSSAKEPPPLSPGIETERTSRMTATLQPGFEGGCQMPHRGASSSPVGRVQSPVSPLQQPPAFLVQSQILQLAKVAENLLKSLPQFEPKPHNAKKKICKDLNKVMSMGENDPRRMDEIRKYASIYGRFDCKRNPQKPLTLHELSVNEAAAQICRLAPALLTRRDDLFALARQVVRDSGYNYCKAQASIGQQSKYRNEDAHPAKRPRVDLNDSAEVNKSQRQERLDQIAEELKKLGERLEELICLSQKACQKIDSPAMRNLQQEIDVVQGKQAQLLLEQNDLLKPMRCYTRRPTANPNDSDRNDNGDSQFSISSAGSPLQELGDSRDSLVRDTDVPTSPSANKSPSKNSKQPDTDFSTNNLCTDNVDHSLRRENGVKVSSPSSSIGGTIVTNPPLFVMASTVKHQSPKPNMYRNRPEYSIESDNSPAHADVKRKRGRRPDFRRLKKPGAPFIETNSTESETDIKAAIETGNSEDRQFQSESCRHEENNKCT